MRHLPGRDECIVPTLVQLDLTKWLNRQGNPVAAKQVLAFTMRCHVLPLSTEIALLAADLCVKHKLATADTIIYASAKDERADLLTCDSHFDGLDGVILVSKQPIQ